jgi:hypothetical protein
MRFGKRLLTEAGRCAGRDPALAAAYFDYKAAKKAIKQDLNAGGARRERFHARYRDTASPPPPPRGQPNTSLPGAAPLPHPRSPRGAPADAPAPSCPPAQLSRARRTPAPARGPPHAPTLLHAAPSPHHITPVHPPAARAHSPVQPRPSPPLTRLPPLRPGPLLLLLLLRSLRLRRALPMPLLALRPATARLCRVREAQALHKPPLSAGRAGPWDPRLKNGPLEDPAGQQQHDREQP